MLEEGKDNLDVSDFLLSNENDGILKLDFLGLGVGDEVRGDVSSVESHTLDELDFVVECLAICNCDSSVFASLFHQLCNKITDFSVSIGGNSGNIGNELGSVHWSGASLELLYNMLNSQIDTSTEIHRVHASSDRLASFLEDSSCQDSCGSCTITCLIVGLRSNLFHQRSTNVL